MNYDNICKFVPNSNNPSIDISTVNFVLEKTRIAEKEHICSMYIMNIVIRGNGILSVNGKEFGIEKGDLFFVVPGCAYSVKSNSELEYAYVSFLGLGAPALIKRISASFSVPVLSGNDELISFWLRALECANPNNTDLVSKSTLLYTAAFLINYTDGENVNDTVAKAEEYVRTHFSDSELSLKKLATKFGYNEKYLSKLFYRSTGMYFVDYLTNLRVNAACAILQNSKSSVKEAAELSGFSDALYFSKVFKRKVGITPTEFIKGNSL